jgi:ABC-type branched-subunit amino acid transport system permease subunit
VVVTFVGYCVARLRTSATGRMLVAVRSNERAAASVGIRVAPVKLYVFALSAFIAGIGGSLLAYEQGTVSSASFTVQTSLALLAVAYVAGIGRIAGAVIAGLMFASDGLFVSFLDKEAHIGQYQTIVAGVALAFTAIQNPDGVASEVAGEKGPAPRLVRVRDRLIPGARTSTSGRASVVAETERVPTPASRV